jgi:divalent metal cation (Fe/Co/Zn/Cd) transporter
MRISMVVPDLHPHLQTDARGIGPTRRERRAAVRRARLLNVATIGWNSVEGVVAIAAGVAAGSVSLVGFGIDSVIEVSAAVILAWRLHQERNGGCMQAADARATKAIGASFAALAIYVAYGALGDLIDGNKPEASTVGVALAAVSLALMPALAMAKARLAPVLGSAAAKADAAQTNLCALLSAVVLVGVGANWAAGWWWADPIAGLGIAVIAGAEAVRTWQADSLEDTCCA